MKVLTLIGAACVVAMVSATVCAQDKSVRVRGTIDQIEGGMMIVKSGEGDTLRIKLADNGSVVALEKASLADIKPNSYVGSTAMPQPDGTWKAVESTFFRKPCEGPAKATGHTITGRKAP